MDNDEKYNWISIQGGMKDARKKAVCSLYEQSFHEIYV